MRNAIGWLWAIAGATLISGCQRSRERTLWLAPSDYDVQLVVAERGRLTAELQQAVGRTRDTAMVLVHVDSIVRDSIFGSYTSESMHSLGVMVGRATPGPQLIAGSIGAGRFSLTLSPDARDAGLILEGASVGDTGDGSWRVESGATKGNFHISRR
jgi:hypothetical protein